MSRRAGVVYRLNSKDEFIYVGGAWVDFAVANDAPEVLPERVMGRRLWEFIADESTRQLYAEILRQVRAGRPARFNFRCDAPERRRLMEMTISPREGGEVEVETRTLREEERPRQELLDRNAPRSGDLLRVCSWCNRADVGGGRWGEVEEAVTAFRVFERAALPMLTHGMCDSCFKVVNKEIAEHRARAQQRRAANPDPA